MISAQYVSNKNYIKTPRGAKNRIKFESVEAPEAGMYELKLYVVSSGKTKISIRTNKYESVEVKDIVGIQGNGSAVGCVSTQVYLDKGENDIYIYAPSTSGPGLDRIAVSKAKVEDGTVPKEATDYPELYAEYPEVTPTPVPTPKATPAPSETPAPSDVSNVTVQPTETNKPANTAVQKPAKVKKITLSSKKKQMTIKISKVKYAKGYQVVYGTDKKLKKRVKKLTTKKLSVTIKKLKSKKKYYVKVRAYANGKSGKIYGAWSKVKKIKVK